LLEIPGLRDLLEWPGLRDPLDQPELMDLLELPGPRDLLERPGHREGPQGPQGPAGESPDAEALALKANQTDQEALGTVVATKANQVLVNSLQVQLGSLSAEVDGKQSQLRASYEEGSHPLLTASYDDDLVLRDTIRALKVTAPLVVSQTSQLLDLSLDGSLSTQEGLDSTIAQLLPTKNNVNSLFASNEALSGEVDTLAA
jgi:hypothetical protein